VGADDIAGIRRDIAQVEWKADDNGRQ